jgi:hypothetical protein
MVMFDEKTITEIRKISRLPGSQVDSLAERLEAIGVHFREIVLTVPTKMRLGPQDRASSARQEWLRERVQRPIDHLLASIEQSEMLAPWPDSFASELSDEDWTHLRTLLSQLKKFSEELCDSLKARSADSSTLNAELRFEIVSQLADACRDAGLQLSRHRYREMGYKSPAAQIIQLACKEICGATFPVDQHLRDYLKLHQEK